MHVRLICATKFYLLTHLLTYLLTYFITDQFSVRIASRHAALCQLTSITSFLVLLFIFVPMFVPCHGFSSAGTLELDIPRHVL